jgi:hypothetical protein
MYFENGSGDRQLQTKVVMHGDIAKAHHAFEFVRQSRFYPAALRQ